MHPCAWLVVALVLESQAVLVGVVAEKAIGKDEVDRIAAALRSIVKIKTPGVVVVDLKTMLPARWQVKRQLDVAEKIVLPGATVGVLRQFGNSGEVPEAGSTGTGVEVPGAEAKHGPLRKLHADVAALEVVEIRIVDVLAVGAEVIAEKVVVETLPRSR